MATYSIRDLLERLTGKLQTSGVAELVKYIPLGEAAKLYQVSDDTLRRLIGAGKLTRHRRPYDKRIWLLRWEVEALFGRPKSDEG